MKLRFDQSQFTFGDAIDLEESGYSLADVQRLFAAGEVPARLAAVLVWLVRRKEEPTFTFEDAKALPIEELEVEIVGGEGGPKGAPSNGASPPSVSEQVGLQRLSGG